MVGYNVGSSGGSSGGNNHRDDTAKPDMVLDGYTFHAGESEEQQVGRIKNYSGTIDGNGGDGDSISASSQKDRYIPAGVYVARNIKIEKVPTEAKEVSPTGEDQTITPSPGKFLSEVKVKGFSFSEIKVYPDDERTIFKIRLGIKPTAICLSLSRQWDDDSNIDPIVVGLYVVRDGNEATGWSYGKVALANKGGEAYSKSFSNIVDQVTWGDTSFEIYLTAGYFDEFLSYNVLVFGTES